MRLIVYIHLFGYRKVIYKDDGRDLVTMREFICVNFTYSALHQWVTYMTVFTLFKSTVDSLGLTEGSDSDSGKFDIVSILGVVSMTIMFLETSIYISYKKDILFSLMSLIDFIGIYVYNMKWNRCCN
jgi:hypothetical protein